MCLEGEIRCPFSAKNLGEILRAIGLSDRRGGSKTHTIHHMRHMFISPVLAGGKMLAKVRDAVGHANISITSAYLHVAGEDDVVGRLFG
jgi:site-specific recombinase XerD